MAIKTYQSNGAVLYQIKVSVRSKADPALRVQKERAAIETEAQAIRAEKQLFAEAMKELNKREHLGLRWGDLIDRFAQALQDGTAKNRAIQTVTADDIVATLKLHTRDWFALPASQINTADVKDLIAKMKAAGLSNSRQRSVQSAINGVFEYAIDRRLLKGVHASPAIGVSISREETMRPEILSRNEIVSFLTLARDQNHEWYRIWAMALVTGMRSGELYALKWVNVDFERKSIVVQESYNGRTKSVKATKGGYWREVPMNGEAERILRELKTQTGDTPEVFPRINRWGRGEAARILRSFLEGAGLPSVKFHTLRACFATQLLRDGVAPATVMKICGWKDLKTMQRYVRLAGIEVQGATDSLKFLPSDAMATVVKLVPA